MKLKRLIKKGFTLVELVVVIAVIAILSIVSVVSYVNVVEEANLSVDKSNVSEMTTMVTTERILNDDITLPEIYSFFKEEGLDLGTQKSKSKGTRFGYDIENQEFGLFDANNGKLIYSVSSTEGGEARNTAFFGKDLIEYSLTNDFDIVDEHKINVSIKSGNSITVNLDADVVGNLTIDAPNITFSQKGIIDGNGYGTSEDDPNNFIFNQGNLIIKNANTVSVSGYVDMLDASNCSVTVTSTGVIREIVKKSNLTLVNNGWINYLADSTGITVTNNGFVGGAWKSTLDTKKASSFNIPLEYDIRSLEDLLKVCAKTQDPVLPYISGPAAVGTSLLTINLVSDLNVDHYTFVSLASWYQGRKENALHLIMNGNNHTISGLRNNFIGGLGAKSQISDLRLLMNYESRDFCSPYENIFYFNENGKIKVDFLKSDGNFSDYYASLEDKIAGRLSYGTNQAYYMHIGCLANMLFAVTGEENKVIVNNLTVGGKFVFKNLRTWQYYCGAIVCGGYDTGTATGTTAEFSNIVIENSFDARMIASDDKYYYSPVAYCNHFGIFVGNHMGAGTFIGNGVNYNPKGAPNLSASTVVKYGAIEYTPWIVEG